MSRIVQRTLGSYEDGNSSQYGQCEGVTKNHAAASSYGYSHKDKIDPSFQNLSYGNSQPLKKYPVLGGSSMVRSKEAPPEAHLRKVDSWTERRDYTCLPPDLADVYQPLEPLSPLHSSGSSDMEPDTDDENNQSLSPERNSTSSKMASKKEASHATGDALPLASQTFPLSLSSKPSLAHSKKPMALVRPMDGPEQVTSGSPDLKPSPEDFHGQPYENLPDLKSDSRSNLTPLKMPSQSVEVSVLISVLDWFAFHMDDFETRNRDEIER